MRLFKQPEPPRQMTLIEELIEMGEDADLLRKAAREYYEGRPRLGQFLVDNGVVSQARVALALARQSKKRGDVAGFFEHLTRVSQVIGDRIRSVADRIK